MVRFSLDPRHFWDDIQTNENLTKIQVFIAAFAVVIALMIYTNVPGESRASSIFLFMGLFTVIFMGFEFFSPRNKIFNFYGFGDNTMMAIASIVVGAVIAFLVIGKKVGLFSVIPVPFSVVGPTFSFIWIWIVVFSPLLEAFFFRGLIFPTLKLQLNNPYLAAGLTSAFFGGYHFYAYGASMSGMVSAGMFSLIMILGIQVFKSIGFEIGWHTVNNYLTFAG